MRYIFIFTIFVFVTFHSFSQVTDSLFSQVISKGTNQKRFKTIKKYLLSDSTLTDNYQQEKIDWLGLYKNIVVTLPGKTDSIIYVTSHYDKVDASLIALPNSFINGVLDFILSPIYLSHGQYDNGTGVALSLTLLQELKNRSNKYTYVFLYTGLEEYGLRGARTHVAKLSTMEYSKIKYAINIDMIGSASLLNSIGVSADVSDAYVFTLVKQLIGNHQLDLHEDIIKNSGGSSDFEAFQGTSFWKDLYKSYKFNLIGALLPQRSYFTKKKPGIPLINFTDNFDLKFIDKISILLPISFGQIHSFKDKRNKVSLEHLNQYHIIVQGLINTLETR